MKYIFRLALVVSFVFYTSSMSWAHNQGEPGQQCVSQGQHLNITHSLQHNSLDPYAHMLGDLGNTESLANSYDLNLKPLVINDLTKLQFRTNDSRSRGAGYTSPYLWGVGQGPGYKNRFQTWTGAPQTGPLPIRR